MAPPLPKLKFYRPPGVKSGKAKLPGAASAASEVMSETFSKDPALRAVAEDAVMERGKDISPKPNIASDQIARDWKTQREAVGDDSTPPLDWDVTGIEAQGMTRGDRNNPFALDGPITRTEEAALNQMDVRRRESNPGNPNWVEGRRLLGAAGTVAAGAAALGSGEAEGAPKLKWKMPKLNTLEGKLAGEASSVAKSAAETFSASPEARAVAQDTVMEHGKDVSPPVNKRAKAQWEAIKRAQEDFDPGDPGAHESLMFSKADQPDYRKVAPTASYMGGSDSPTTQQDMDALHRTFEAEGAQDATRSHGYGEQVMGGAGTIGAGALAAGALAAGSAQAQTLQGAADEAGNAARTEWEAFDAKLTPEFFVGLGQLSPGARRAWFLKRTPAERARIMQKMDEQQAYEESPDRKAVEGMADMYAKANTPGAPGGRDARLQWNAEAANRHGYENDKTQQSQLGTMQGAEIEDMPQDFHVAYTKGGVVLDLKHKRASFDIGTNDPVWKQLVKGLFFLPNALMKQAEFTVEAEQKLLDPLVIDPLQKSAAETRYGSVPKMREGSFQAGTPWAMAPQLAMAGAKMLPESAVPAADMLYRTGAKWIFGRDNLDAIAPADRLKAINDIGDIFASPLGRALFTPTPMAGWATGMTDSTGKLIPDKAAEYTQALAEGFGQAPLFMFGPTQAMEMAVAGKAGSSIALNAGFGAVQALTDPEMNVVEGGAGAGAVGAGFVGMFVGGKFLADSMGSLWKSTFPKAAFQPLTETGATIGGYTPSLTQSIHAGIASDTPAIDITEVPMPVAARFNDGKLKLRPSVALLGADEIRFYELNGKKKPKVTRVFLGNEKDANLVDAILHRYGLNPIPVEGALDSINPFVRDFMHPELGTEVVTRDGAVVGNRAAGGDVTNAGAGRKQSSGPGAMEMSPDGHIDIYRLSDPKARAKGIRALNPVKGMSLDGQEVQGFLIQTPDGMAVHPGHDMDQIPGFVEQLVPLMPGKPPKPLNAKEIDAISKMTPEHEEMQRRLLGFGDEYVERGYGALVDDAHRFMETYYEKNPGFREQLDAELEVRRAGRVSEPMRENMLGAIRTYQRFEQQTDETRAAYRDYKRAIRKPTVQTPLIYTGTVESVLRNEFKLSKELAQIVALDVTGRLGPMGPGTKGYGPKQKLLLEWAEKRNNALARRLAEDRKLPPVLKDVGSIDTASAEAVPGGRPDRAAIQPGMRSQNSRPDAAPDVDSPEFQMGGIEEGAEAVAATAAREASLAKGDDVLRALAAADEAARAGETVPQVWVNTPDGQLGRIIAVGQGKADIVTDTGAVVAAINDLTLHQPPAPPPDALMKGVGTYDSVDGVAKLTNDLATALRTSPDDKQLFLSIQRQAREDGRTTQELIQATAQAQQLAADPSQALKPSNFARQGGQPPVPPPPPPGGGPGLGGAPMSPQTSGTLKTAIRNFDVFDKMVKTVFGNRATLLSQNGDLVKVIDQVYGAKALSEQLKGNIERSRNMLGMRQGGDFDKMALQVLKGERTYAEAQQAFPHIFNNRELRDNLASMKVEIDRNEKMLMDLGMLNIEKPDDTELTNYITNFYMRRFMDPGDWAKIALQDKPLMNAGREMFTRLWEAKGLQGQQLKDAAEWSLHSMTGDYDKKLIKAAKQNQQSPQSALRQRVLDELEEAILKSVDPKTQLTKKGLRPGDVDTMRKLMGQNESAILGTAMTLTKQRALVAQGQAFRKFVAAFPELTSPTPKPDWMEVPMNRGKYGDLAGKFVHPEAYDSLIGIPEFVAENNKMMMGLASFVKTNQIPLGGLGTFNTNLFGSMKGAVLSGAFDVGSTPNVREALSVLVNGNKSHDSIEAFMANDLMRLGVDAPGFNQTEIGSSRNDVRNQLYAQWGAKKEVSLTELAKTMLSAVKWAPEKAGALYDDMDRLWKMASFFRLVEKGGFDYRGGVVDKRAAAKFLAVTEEVKRYKEQFSKKQWANLSPDERLPPAWRIDSKALAEAVKQEAALRITSSFPMPDRVSPMMKETRGMVGVVAPYLTYKSEEARVNLAIAQRIKRGEYGLIGRTMGMLAAGASAAELSRQMAYANGITKEEIDAAYAFDSPGNKRYRYARIVIPMRDALGRVEFMDFSQYGDWLNGGMQLSAAARGNDPIKERLGAIAKDVLFFPFAGGDGETYGKQALYAAGLEEAPYSQTLREDQKGFTAVADTIIRGGGLPKIGSWGYDIYRDANQPANGKYEPATTGQAAKRAMGFRSWGVGPISETRARRSYNAEVKGTVKQQIGVQMTPEGTVGRQVGSGVIDKPEAVETIREKRTQIQEEYWKRLEILNKKSERSQK